MINNLIVVEVPEDAYGFWLKQFVDSSIGYYDKKEYQNFIPFKEALNCKILGKLSELPEFITLLQSHGVDTTNPNTLLILEKL